MTDDRTELFILYQMGASEDWTWYSVVGVFFSQGALREDAKRRGASSDLELMEPSAKNEVVLTEPQGLVAVRSHEGPVPDVELAVSE
jgi:hypothetical protein